MTQTLTVNTARSNVHTALVAAIAQPYTPKAFPTLTFGETVDITLYLVTEGGAIDARSGTTGYTPRVSVLLPTLQPTDGAFTINDGTETITADYDIGAQNLETALNAMNDGAGPFNDQCAVTKFADGTFSILFDTVGDKSELTVSASGIQPTSAASVLPLVEGDATTREEQLIRILAEPLVFEDSATQITDGWAMTLNANNANILRATAAEQGDLSANYSIEVVAPTAAVNVVARGPVIVKEASFDIAALSGITYPEIPNLDAAIIQRVDIIGLTGGAITDLDSIATEDLPIDYTVFTGVQVGVSAPGKQWTLTSGTEAENPAGGIVRPDDYNETTNAKYWQVTL